MKFQDKRRVGHELSLKGTEKKTEKDMHEERNTYRPATDRA